MLLVQDGAPDCCVPHRPSTQWDSSATLYLHNLLRGETLPQPPPTPQPPNFLGQSQVGCLFSSTSVV